MNPSTIQTRLPATFRSVYRLFLRTSSATVLHHKQARRSLRERWRPVFDAGAKVIYELQDKPDDASDTWVREREEWLKNWDERSVYCIPTSLMSTEPPLCSG